MDDRVGLQLAMPAIGRLLSEIEAMVPGLVLTLVGRPGVGGPALILTKDEPGLAAGVLLGFKAESEGRRAGPAAAVLPMVPPEGSDARRTKLRDERNLLATRLELERRRFESARTRVEELEVELAKAWRTIGSQRDRLQVLELRESAVASACAAHTPDAAGPEILLDSEAKPGPQPAPSEQLPQTRIPGGKV